MTVTPLRPHSNYANIDDCVVAAFVQALDMKKAAKADHSLDCMLPGAAYEGMMETVALEGISTDAHAALAIATAINRVEELIRSGNERDEGLDVYDLMSLEHIRLILSHLWDHVAKPNELAPIAEHFGLRMHFQTA